MLATYGQHPQQRPRILPLLRVIVSSLGLFRSYFEKEVRGSVKRLARPVQANKKVSFGIHNHMIQHPDRQRPPTGGLEMSLSGRYDAEGCRALGSPRLFADNDLNVLSQSVEEAK